MQRSEMLSTIKKLGVWRALYAMLMSRYRHRLMLCWVVVRPPYPPDPTALPDSLEARVATLEELVAASTDPLADLNPDWVKKAYKRGEFCAAVYEGSKIISYTWRAFGPTPHEKGLEVHFDPQYVYGFYSYTHPDYRRKGLQHVVDCISDQHLVAMGYSEGIGFVETHNYPSWLSQAKRGARRVGYAGYLTLFGRLVTFRSPGAKKHGFGFFPAERAPASAELGEAAKLESNT